MNKINCLKCIHYYSTWDPQTPRGCKAYGLKTQGIPSLIIKRESGSDCQAYKERKAANKKEDTLDLNRDDLW